MSYFPMFIELENVPCLIVGGGRIALRKVEVLLDFGASITVVASEIIEEIVKMETVQWIKKDFEIRDLIGMSLVVAATDDKELNHIIASACKEQKIPVNAVDQIEDCSFIFPAYLKNKEVVSAFSSGGQSPVITQYLKKKTAPLMSGQIGELALHLGALRETVKEQVETEQERKRLYQEILHLGIAKNELPSEEEVAEILSHYIN